MLFGFVLVASWPDLNNPTTFVPVAVVIPVTGMPVPVMLVMMMVLVMFVIVVILIGRSGQAREHRKAE
jgi:ABC-type transport system involved in cytochrome bd biosynthesis fused ATPase/permease subunit